MDKRVLIACFSDVSKGGGGRRALNTAAALKMSGYDVSVLSHSKVQDRSGVSGGIPINYHFTDADWAWRAPLLNREKKIVNFLKTTILEPDYFLPISPYYVNAARKAWPHVKIIYLFPCLLWRCMPFADETYNQGWLGHFNHWLLGRSERNSFIACDRLVVQGPSVIQDIQDFYPVEKSKLAVIPSGVADLIADIGRSKEQVREDFDTPLNARVFLTVGVVDSNKNQQNILRAMAESRYNEMWLWVVGSGPQLEENIHLANNLGIASRVKFLGARNDMPDIYAAADVYIHAAWYDNFPNVYLEAMVSGLPVIGPRGEFPSVVSPLDRMICDGEQGFTYSLLETESLTKTLENVSKMECGILHQIGQRARQLALTEYSWSGFSKRLSDVIESL